MERSPCAEVLDHPWKGGVQNIYMHGGMSDGKNILCRGALQRMKTGHIRI